MKPPIDTPGYWILRDEFKGIKSFGHFVCENAKCKNNWTSAHANKEFRQGCKLCDKRALPAHMWVNTHKLHKDKDVTIKLKPHDSTRCEACEKGVCIQSVVTMIEPIPIQRDDLDIRRSLLREKIRQSLGC
jgi:hypothetical protein